MGKNKGKGKKQKNVFRVANTQSKLKNKAKPVTSSLKQVQINAVKNMKVENLNQIFTEVQRDSVSKNSAPKEPKQKMQVSQQAPREVVNVDGTAQLFSQL